MTLNALSCRSEFVLLLELGQQPFVEGKRSLTFFCEPFGFIELG